jgi:hypothetical protein
VQQLLALGRLKQAWELNVGSQNREALVSLAREALKQLEIDEAIRAYRELQDPAMVLALKAIRHIEVPPLPAAIFLDY